MLKAARERLVRELRDDADLFTTVGGRIYPEDLATLTNPTYPCVTVSFNSGIADEFISDLADASISIQTYSAKSYNQCWDIYEKVKTTLAFGVFTDASVRIRMTEGATPIERYDTESRVHMLTSGWDMKAIGV